MGHLTNSQVFIQFLAQIEQHVVDYSLNEYCCRIVQRMFEKCHPCLVTRAADIIVGHFRQMCHNEYGIFVLSAMLENGMDQHKNGIL
jgi:hypothetical protein